MNIETAHSTVYCIKGITFNCTPVNFMVLTTSCITDAMTLRSIYVAVETTLPLLY